MKKSRKNRKVSTKEEAKQFASAVNRVAIKTTQLELARLNSKGVPY